MKILEITPSSIVLPQGFPVRRNYTRAASLVTDEYIEKYDADTLFYDVFIVGREIIAVSPPLLNLEFLLDDCWLVYDGDKKIKVKVDTWPMERTQLSRIQIPSEVHRVHYLHFYATLDREKYMLSVTPAPDMSECFRDSKGLMTLQVDNQLDWIGDWARYYRIVHDVDTVVLYDNNSSSYTSSELAARLAKTVGLSTVIVVRWPFKYGPQGKPWMGPDVPWDSDFCQIGALQDASLRFFSQGSFINADIDELIVPLSDVTVFDVLKNTEVGVIGVIGPAIAPVSSNSNCPLQDDVYPRVFHLWEKSEALRVGGRKWVGCPERWPRDAQCTAHYVRKIAYDPDPRFSLAHFRPINNGWKNKDRTIMGASHEELRPDFALLSALFKVFPEKIRVESLCEALPQAENMIVKLERDNANACQRVQQIEIALGVSKVRDWSRIWVWRDDVFVYEHVFEGFGTVAFDLYPASRGGGDLYALFVTKSMLRRYMRLFLGWGDLWCH